MRRTPKPKPKIVTIGPHYAHKGKHALKACYPTMSECCGWMWNTSILMTYTAENRPSEKAVEKYIADNDYLLLYGIKNRQLLTNSQIVLCEKYGLLDRNKPVS